MKKLYTLIFLGLVMNCQNSYGMFKTAYNRSFSFINGKQNSFVRTINTNPRIFTQQELEDARIQNFVFKSICRMKMACKVFTNLTISFSTFSYFGMEPDHAIDFLCMRARSFKSILC